MKRLIELLHSEGCSCVIESQGEIRAFRQHGVADLYDLYQNERDFMQNAQLADKVIGKGAAALIVLGKMKEVYADIISTPALSLLRAAGIKPRSEKKCHLSSIVPRQEDVRWNHFVQKQTRQKKSIR